MKAIRIHGPSQFQLDNIDYPRTGPDDVLVQVKACGVCGSDLAYIAAGQASFNQVMDGPSALGHEAAGTIVDMGSQVTGFAVGDRVVINPIDQLTGSAIGNGLPEGAFAEVVAVRNISQGGRLIKMPDTLPFTIAALAEPMGVALHAVNRSGATEESKVVVFGVGPIGLGAVIWLRHKGVKHIVAVDFSADRLARAQLFGANDIIRADAADLAGILKQVQGTSPDGAPDTDIFLDASGSSQVIADVINMAKFRAHLAVVAIHKKPVSIDLCNMVIKEINLTTAMGYPTELEEVVQFLAQHTALMHHYISDEYSLPEFDQAVIRAREGSSAKVMVQIETA